MGYDTYHTTDHSALSWPIEFLQNCPLALSGGKNSAERKARKICPAVAQLQHGENSIISFPCFFVYFLFGTQKIDVWVGMIDEGRLPTYDHFTWSKNNLP